LGFYALLKNLPAPHLSRISSSFCIIGFVLRLLLSREVPRAPILARIFQAIDQRQFAFTIPSHQNKSSVWRAYVSFG
jgi:hypothetical protein